LNFRASEGGPLTQGDALESGIRRVPEHTVLGRVIKVTRNGETVWTAEDE
jgi:hypothetical protein